MENFSNDELDKKIDIELRKKEFEKKYGASFSPTNNNISPELENEWLNYIEQFEQQFEKKETIAVWDYLGKPVFRKVSEIDSEAISGELDYLMNYMNDHQIVLYTLCQVDEKELYRFITEELFIHEIDNIRIKGMNTSFIYEEFYPNAEYDIRSAYDYFFRSTMAKRQKVGGEGYDMLFIDVKNYKDQNGNKLDKEMVSKAINTFLDSFDYFEFITNEIISVDINEDKTDAKLNFEIEYKGRFNQSAEFMLLKGNGCFQIKPSDYGGWDIYNIRMPGLKI
jgi:hypothetical protein